jgi:lipopolysaccharide export system protein LptA
VTIQVKSRRLAWAIVGAAVAAVLALGASGTAAQTPKKTPGGFSVERKGPVKIAAKSLEVRDKDKKATFKGDVHVVQGDTEVRCSTLIVHYISEMRKTAGAGDATKRGNDQIRRMEALGGVTVTQKDQTATGDRADFDMATNTVTLRGNVVVTKGDDVLRGHRLVVDLTSGVSRMESGGGRVEGLFGTAQPDKSKSSGSAPKKDSRNESKQPRVSGPTGLY